MLVSVVCPGFGRICRYARQREGRYFISETFGR